MKKQELLKKSEKHAKEYFIKLNPDKKHVSKILDALLKNKKEHGEIYCPCRAITGDKKRDKLIICPCVYHMGEIELKGECLCKLFKKL